MRRKRRQFSREFKVEAVRQLRESTESANAVARELGIGADVLRRWRDELQAQGVEPAHRRGRRDGVRATMASDDEELRRLRRENAVLREEREILKKAMAFFAKDTR
jgi:transposase